MIEYKYVNENAEVYENEVAKRLLEEHSDNRFFGNNGIIQIDKKRWEEAQRYESSEWLERCANMNNDRNDFHEEIFENYNILTDLPIESMIELGCGPFTNARNIIKKLPSIQELTLLDPLAHTYMKEHINCSYKNVDNISIVNSSIEDFKVEKTYDLVVMINVLEHCFDIPKIFENIDKMTKKGSYFVYADVQFDYDVAKRISEIKFNSGHPIRVTKDYINTTISGLFDPIFHKTFEEIVAGEQAEEWYFVGKKK